MLRLTRFETDPARASEMQTRRAALIDAVRSRHPGLLEARLARLTDRTWLDIWRWDSAASVEAALADAPELPEAAAAFELSEPVSVEMAEVVDPR